MTNGSMMGRESAQRRSRTFRLRPVAASCAVLLIGVTDVALAQQAEQQVTVTGIRRGIESAISVKKNADNIVEAVSAEDIGKLPDASIAESIARLPGLSAQRVAGRAQVISVRGLSPDFATTLLNGRELVSTGDNRSVEFDQYPSELLSGVTVYKTPDAGLVGQGLSGTLDMQTIRPLNFNSRVVALNARLQRNSLGSAANASANGNRFSFSYVDQFANRTVGLVLGFAHLKTPVQENQVGLYEPWEAKATNVTPGLPAGTFSTGGIKALRRTGELTRDGVAATVEWRPSKEYTGVLDIFHSKAKQVDTANQLEMNLNYNGSFPCDPACVWSGTTINSNQTATAGQLTSVRPLVRGMYNSRDDDITSVGLNNRFKLAGVALDADISWSKAKRQETNLENNTQLANVGGAVPYDVTQLRFNQGAFSTIGLGRDYSSLANLPLSGTIYGSGYGKVPQVSDEMKGLKLVATFGSPMALFADLQAGLSLTNRTKDKVQPEANINLPAGVNATQIGSEYLYGSVNLGFAGLGSIPAWNVPGVVGKYMVFNPAIDQPYLVAKSWAVTEKITTAFVKGNIDTQMMGMDVRGNLGVQLVHSKQSSDGIRFTNNATFAVTDGKTYTDVLPSLNLAMSLGNEQTVRFAAARQMARPKVDQLRASLDFGIDTGTGKPGASGGNAQLDPWRANALDLSYEKYFGNRAYVAVAGFYKDLVSYIYTQSNENYDFSRFVQGYVPPSTCTVGVLTNQPCPPAQFSGKYTAPYNGKGGSLHGVELSASLPLQLLSPALNGFGIIASASFNSSNVSILDPESASSVGSGNIGLPGLSKRTFNLTAYYESGGFEARISQRKRSDFIGEIGNFNGARTLRYVVGESIIDAQVGYTFNTGSLKGLGMLLQVNNLTDAAYETYAGTKDRQLEYQKWGRSIMAGVNYKF